METTNGNINKRATMMVGAGKKLLIVLFSLGLAYGASAQRGGHGIVRGGGGYHYVPSRTYVGVGIGLGYGYGWGYPWGYPYGWYGPWGPYPAYYYGYGAMPSRLQLQIDDIKNDYSAQIKEVRHDKSLARKDRRAKIDELKHDRDAAIIQARKDYYYNSRRNSGQPRNNQQQNGNQPGNQPKNNNGSSSNEEQPEYNDRGATGSSDLQQQ